jgi:hypothetical protein
LKSTLKPTWTTITQHGASRNNTATNASQPANTPNHSPCFFKGSRGWKAD